MNNSNSAWSGVRRLVFGCAVLSSACSPDAKLPAATEPPPFRVVQDVKDVMAHVLDPAADVIWDSAGFVLTVEGEESLAPTTDDGWARVVNNAAVVIETANLLMLPGRSQPGDWMEIASGLADAGMSAKKAAVDRDAEVLFDAGGTLYRVCVSCHQMYWVQEE